LVSIFVSLPPGRPGKPASTHNAAHLGTIAALVAREFG